MGFDDFFRFCSRPAEDRFPSLRVNVRGGFYRDTALRIDGIEIATVDFAPEA